MRILGIESSCDETAAAIVDCEAGGDGVPRAVVLSDVIHSQARLHALYGGVVPELASRDHLARSMPTVHEALTRANVSLDSIDAVAVTAGPGLIGALLVGVQVGKSLAWALGKPLIATNHLAGHVFAIQLSDTPAAFPYVALVVSGGHTALYDVTGPDELELLGQTRDDAAGEAFDKVGKMLGLDYPAGAAIDRLAKDGDPNRHHFPRALRMRSSLDFSFSGIKTSVLNHLNKNGMPEGQDLADLCASFQEAVCDSLVTKALRATRRQGRQRLVLGGGVAANSRLRAMATARGQEEGLEVFVPPIRLCTDNAAMIALAGWHRFRRQGADDLKLNAQAGWRP